MGNVSNKVMEAIGFRELGKLEKEEMKGFANDVVSQFDEIKMATILDEIGEEITSSLVVNQISPIDLQNHLSTISPEKLESIIKDKIKYSSIYFSSGTPYVTFFSAYKFKDRPAPGLIAVAIDLSKVKTLVDDIAFSKSRDGVAILFDASHNIIAGKKENLKIDELNKFKQLGYLKNAWENESSVPASSGEYIDQEQVEHLAAFNFLEDLGWLLFISEPKDKVFASADLLKIRTGGIILITIIISILAGLFMARKVVKPIEILVKGSQEIGAGNLEYKIPELSKDEIGLLGNSFSQMGANLKQREDTISRIRVIASELNSIFQQEKVIETGTKAIEELTNCKAAHVLIQEGEDLKTFYEFKENAQLNKSDELITRLGSSPDIDIVKNTSYWFNEQKETIEMDTLLVPLNKNDPNKGLISKGNLILANENFSMLDQQVAQILAGAMTVSLLNIDFLQSSVANERRQNELELAELVQRTLYPESDPEFEEIELASYLLSSSETGGDWYGYIESEDRRTISVLIGDVTGHGAPAALVTAATNAFFSTVENMSRNMPNIDVHDPVFLLKLLNKVILETAHGRLVMTFFISTLDLNTGEMIFSNAGHNTPWIWRKDPEADHDPKDDPVASTTKVKKAGGKLKIKVGGKAKKTEEPASEEAAPKKKLKIKMGAKKETTPEEEAPKEKKKLKIKMGSSKKKEDDIEKDESPEGKKKLKIKIGGKKSGGEKKSGLKIKKPGKNKINHWENFSTRGMRLGESLDVDYNSKRTMLHEGDIVCWYTDGWVENTNEEHEEYGKKRTQKVLESNFNGPMADAIEKLREASWEFYGNEPREDDVTIVLGKVKAKWGP